MAERMVRDIYVQLIYTSVECACVCVCVCVCVCYTVWRSTNPTSLYPRAITVCSTTSAP